ncbi:hypothetical protein [Neisseria sp. CCUG12390]|uniref:hypothetical protein n=1 Tax=Neisseria sp. CCUG12390 TaxID=3392035 RepID=UPI003A0FFD63
MNNNLNAKLSKLVYTPMSDTEDGISEAASFDRFILLIRRIYQMLDEQNGLTQVTLRIRSGQKQGLVTLDAAAPQTDSATLRLKRWSVYSGIAKHLAGCNDLSVTLQDTVIADSAEKESCAEAIDGIIARFGLTEKAASEPALQTPPAETGATEADEAEPSKKSIRSIIAYRGKSLNRIGTQAKTETYKSAPAGNSLRVSRLSFGGYKQK